MHLIFTLGPTNSGKSSFLRQIETLYPNQAEMIRVGDVLRAKYLDPGSPNYNPNHFKGSAAPQHTAAEAWDVLVKGISKASYDGKFVAVCDGQPRDIKQCDDIQWIYGNHPELYTVTYVNLYCPLEIRKARSAARDQTPDQVELAAKRMEGDILKIYEILCRIQSRGGRIITVDTSQDALIYSKLARHVVSGGDAIWRGVPCQP
jgi:energy-coupling factor transporter ATP-binding protein EcfA2